jgi:hypothetical protein
VVHTIAESVLPYSPSTGTLRASFPAGASKDVNELSIYLEHVALDASGPSSEQPDLPALSSLHAVAGGSDWTSQTRCCSHVAAPAFGVFFEVHVLLCNAESAAQDNLPAQRQIF